MIFAVCVGRLLCMLFFFFFKQKTAYEMLLCDWSSDVCSSDLEIWSYINAYMLYGRHLGFRGDFEKRLAERDPKAVELFENMEEVKKEAGEFMKIRAVWQFFEAEAEGESLHLFVPGTKEPMHTFRFPRQRQGDFLCLSDYTLPPQKGRRDHLALFVVTAGEGIRE